jgi:hypothetical protein
MHLSLVFLFRHGWFISSWPAIACFAVATAPARGAPRASAHESDATTSRFRRPEKARGGVRGHRARPLTTKNRGGGHRRPVSNEESTP